MGEELPHIADPALRRADSSPHWSVPSSSAAS